MLRFFVYWRQARQRTDYDLSALMLDEHYGNPRARLLDATWPANEATRTTPATSPTAAATGPPSSSTSGCAATPRRFIIPQVNIYAGEGFDEVEEAFFGFMTRDGASRASRSSRAPSG